MCSFGDGRTGSRERRWRLAFAVLGVAGYWLLGRPDWSSPAVLLYDVPTLCVCWSWLGSLMSRVVARAPRRGDPVRWVVIPPVLVLALGVEHAGWPFSGHLLCATVVAVLETGDRRNAPWLRAAVIVPVVLLVCIRTFWPQSPRMAVHGNTIRALIVGIAMGAAALLAIRRSREAPRSPCGP